MLVSIRVPKWPLSKRVYHHYRDLEEFHGGMWRICRGMARRHNSVRAATLLRDSVAFLAAMRRAVAEWPKSCDHNLTADGNKLAWLGWAACCIAVGSPEENTRIGWHMLNPAEQCEANRVAQVVLDEWEATRGTIDPDQLGLFPC